MPAIFTTGTPQTITDVLAARDERAAYQQTLMGTYPQSTIVAIKLNIPGPIKNNNELRRLFMAGFNRFMATQTAATIIADWNRATGNETFLVIEADLITCKRMAVAFEGTDSLGRLFDIDVMQQGKSRAVSRTELSLPVRRCLLCQREAKDCARSRRHSVAALQAHINDLYKVEFTVGDDD